MIALLLAGTIVLCAGLLTVVFGIPIKEFSFGNTMILAGAMVASTGIVLIGLSFVIRELRNLVRRLDEVGFAVPRVPVPAVPAPAPVEAPRGRSEPAQPKAARNPRAAAKADVLFSREEEIDPDFAEEAHHPPHAPSLSPQWADEPDMRPRPPAPPRPPERVSETGERRRDILFSSSRREQTREVNGALAEFIAPPDAFSDRDPLPDPFEAGRPDPGRARAEPDFAGRAPRNGARPHPLRRNEASSVTVVKSGVVDTMAYSLYSDGSIEAQLPEGMVRFDSIDDLRAHLDQRG
ncbi:MAG: hypothetical protein EKK40_15360 [Bradyrhizobiaceae bacterium]|nr:MAG: hypothetical protein EKK40_15360 [Bradyrhizobiaceae bacterium]